MCRDAELKPVFAPKPCCLHKGGTRKRVSKVVILRGPLVWRVGGVGRTE